MTRKLPWKRSGQESPLGAPRSSRPSLTPIAGRRPRVKSETYCPDVSTRPARKKTKRSTSLSKRSTSTSPPPEPLEETFMIEGLEADDRYRMVEDELLFIAQRFTAHLHAAEYQRLKEASKSQNAKTIKDISRPVVGPMTELAKRKQERKARAGKQRLARKKALADQDDTESESDDHYRGTSLFGLMESPVKKATRLDPLVATSMATRAAAGFEETKHRKTTFFSANPRPMLHSLPESRQSKNATLAQAHDETSDDDLDAPELSVIPKPDQRRPQLRGRLPQRKSEHPATKSQRPISPSRAATDQIATGSSKTDPNGSSDDSNGDFFSRLKIQTASHKNNRERRKQSTNDIRPVSSNRDVIPGFL
ncbi:hypothetical protein DL769_007440 [Monosporascus sp. CRB-8-3]|nr:hypothetical protein DL769_007440 [Monosporascus sp. CRB-8-3]